MFKALKFVLGKIFSVSNVTGPLKFLARVLFGIKLLSKEEKL